MTEKLAYLKISITKEIIMAEADLIIKSSRSESRKTKTKVEKSTFIYWRRNG